METTGTSWGDDLRVGFIAQRAGIFGADRLGPDAVYRQTHDVRPEEGAGSRSLSHAEMDIEMSSRNLGM